MNQERVWQAALLLVKVVLVLVLWSCFFPFCDKGVLILLQLVLFVVDDHHKDGVLVLERRNFVMDEIKEPPLTQSASPKSKGKGHAVNDIHW